MTNKNESKIRIVTLTDDSLLTKNAGQISDCSCDGDCPEFSCNVQVTPCDSDGECNCVSYIDCDCENETSCESHNCGIDNAIRKDNFTDGKRKHATFFKIAEKHIG